jgi:signal peptidase I
MDTATRPVTVARRVVDAAIASLVLVVLVGLFLGRVVPLTGRDTLVIGGASMEPAIPIGAAVVIEPVQTAQLRVGDIVTIRVGPKPSVFTHRIVRLLILDGEPYIETKGDANPTPDPVTTPAAAIVGRVGWSIPFAGYLLALLSLPMGVAFVIGLGITLVLTAVLLEDIEDPRPVAPERAWAGLDPAVAPAYGGPPLEGRVVRHLDARRRLRPQARPQGRPG